MWDLGKKVGGVHLWVIELMLLPGVSLELLSTDLGDFKGH